MSGSVRSFLAAGAVAAVASAIVVAPPPPGRTAERSEPISVARIDLAAAATPISFSPPDREEFTAASDALSRLDPDAAAALAAPPTTLNAASDSINSIYQWIQGWVDYGVELTQYVLQFIPYGYLIGDQVGIVYYNLVRPISDSVVYDFIDPVVNDPLNIWSYINGAVAVGSTTVTALINTGIAEFNYFFGWLIPPLPPLPFAAEVTTEEPQLTALTVSEAEPAVIEEVQEAAEVEEVAAKTTPEPTVAEVKAEPVEAVQPVEPVEAVEPVEKEKPTVDSKDGVSAQGEVRTGGQTAPPAGAPESVADDDDAPAAEPTQPTSPTAATPTTDAGADESDAAKPAESAAPGGTDNG